MNKLDGEVVNRDAEVEDQYYTLSPTAAGCTGTVLTVPYITSAAATSTYLTFIPTAEQTSHITIDEMVALVDRVTALEKKIASMSGKTLTVCKPAEQEWDANLAYKRAMKVVE